MDDREADLLRLVGTDRGVAFAKGLCNATTAAQRVEVLAEAADVFRTLDVAGFRVAMRRGWRALEDRLWILAGRDSPALKLLYPAMIHALATGGQMTDASTACLRYALVLHRGSLEGPARDWWSGLRGKPGDVERVVESARLTLSDLGLDEVLRSMQGERERRRSGIDELYACPRSLDHLRPTVHRFFDGPARRLISGRTDAGEPLDPVTNINDANTVVDITYAVLGGISSCDFEISAAILGDLVPSLVGAARSATESATPRVTGSWLQWPRDAAQATSRALNGLVANGDPLVRYLASGVDGDGLDRARLQSLTPRSMALYSGAMIELVDTLLSQVHPPDAAGVVDRFVQRLDQLCRTEMRPGQAYAVLTLGMEALEIMAQRIPEQPAFEIQRHWDQVANRVADRLTLLLRQHWLAVFGWDVHVHSHLMTVRSATGRGIQ